MNILEKAEQRCKNNGARFTTKRKQALMLLLTANKAISAYDLLDAFKENFNETLPATSIYRILDFLIDEGLVHKIDIANKYIACEHIQTDKTDDEMQFIICQSCQKVKELSLSQNVLNELTNNVKKAGFRMIEPKVEMNCICHECFEKASFK